MLKKIPKLAVYISLFLIPLFTLPFTANTLDFQKQLLLFVIASLGVFAWMWNAINEKKLELNLNPLHWLVTGFTAAVLISGIFSLYVYGSLWGTPLPVAESFISILSFVFFYFLLVNSFKKEDVRKLVAVAGISAAAAAFFALLQSMGIYLLPFLDYTKNVLFNSVGASASLAIYLAIVLSLIFPLAFSAKKGMKVLAFIVSLILFIALVFLNGTIMIHFPQKTGSGEYSLLLAPWIVLAVGMLSVFVFSASSQKFLSRNPRAKGASFALFFVAILFLVFNIFAKPMMSGVYNSTLGFLNVQSASEIQLAPEASTKIAINVLKQSPQYFFLGSGPGTFVYDFVRFKPQELTRDDFGRNLTFFAGSSEITNRIATTGVLGITALILMIIFWTAQAFRFLTEEENDEILPLAVFSGWLAVVVAMFFYPFNFSLALLFWLFLGVIVVLNSQKTVSLSLKSVRLSYAVTLIFIAVAVLQVGLLVWVSKRYYAEVQYASAVKALQKNDVPGAIRNLEAAAEATDRLQDNYLTGLSQVYFAQAQEAIQKENQDAQAAFETAAPYLQTAVTAAAMSTDAANPNNSENWALRGYIYRQLIGVSEGFDAWALDMYQKAIDLDPNNASLWTEIGQVHVMKNDLTSAQESFEKATALSPQLVDPHYYLALIYDKQNQKEKAIQELNFIWQLLPQDDTASKENVAKAIQNLESGGSLSAPPAQEASLPVESVESVNEGEAGETGGSGNETPDESSDESESSEKIPAVENLPNEETQTTQP